MTNERSGTLSVIDTAKALADLEHAVVDTVDVASWANSVSVAPDSRTVYVTRQSAAPGGNTVVVLDTRTNGVTATIPACSVDSPPFGVTITPNGESLYVICTGLDNVWIIDTKTMATTNIVPVGKLPIDLAATPDGRFVYVANFQDLKALTPGDVSVIDTASRTVVATIPVGNNPVGAGITPDGRFAYVVNSQGPSSEAPVTAGNVSVIDTESNTVIETIPVGLNPTGGAISPLPMCVDGHPTCVGDCGVDRQVTVDEILTMVNIALGNLSTTECLAGDANGDHQITVDEILTAVNNALNGCATASSSEIGPEGGTVTDPAGDTVEISSGTLPTVTTVTLLSVSEDSLQSVIQRNLGAEGRISKPPDSYHVAGCRRGVLVSGACQF